MSERLNSEWDLIAVSRGSLEYLQGDPARHGFLLNLAGAEMVTIRLTGKRQRKGAGLHPGPSR